MTLHHGRNGLNAENTLRLEAHRQLFQSHDLIRSGGEDLHRGGTFQPQPQFGGYDLTRPLGGLQYFTTVNKYLNTIADSTLDRSRSFSFIYIATQKPYVSPRL